MNTAQNQSLRDKDVRFMRTALSLANRGYGRTSPNPMVGALLVKRGKIIGRGWHKTAGQAHAEVLALEDARKTGHDPRGAQLFVTLEPCSTQGRTPPCTDAIIAAGIKKVIVATEDPNPRHCGAGLKLLKTAGIAVTEGVLGERACALNAPFNHWIVNRTPYVTVKAAMTLDGKIATASGQSKWITGEKARAHAMKLRKGADAILVGINTVLADNPSLTVRKGTLLQTQDTSQSLTRVILDSRARTPLGSKVVSDQHRTSTIIVVTRAAPQKRIEALSKRVTVWTAPTTGRQVKLGWLLKKLGRNNITGLLIEGGGEVNASFLLEGHAHEIAFFYAPKILGGVRSRRAVAGAGLCSPETFLTLEDTRWRCLGDDLLLTAKIKQRRKS